LQRAGYQVVTAAGGREALAAVEGRSFDLVLLDVMMPEVSGLDVLAELRRRFSVAELPVIMATARNESTDVVEALRLGANDYVTKPIDFPVLLARARTQLELRRLAQLKDDFIRIASHDIKNPLTEVLGVASLVELTLQPGMPLPERTFELVRGIGASARRMQNLIEDFLDFQALQDGQLALTRAPLDLNATAREVAEGNTAYADGKAIGLALALDPALPLLVGDTRRIGQVAQNLINNAIKFSPPGARIDIATHVADGEVVFEVADGGPGIRPEDRERLFTRYGRTENRPTGGEQSTGLGLAICRQLIESHRGRIGMRPGASVGSVFWFALPLAD
jgi:signal transduction histidine kinase